MFPPKPMTVLALAMSLAACSATTPAPHHTVGPLQNGSVATCPAFGPSSHDDPALEALLPKSVAGRELVAWSSAGWCLIDGLTGDVPKFVQFASLLTEHELDPEQFRIALAGRSDANQDPPYFVYVMHLPSDNELRAVAANLLAGAVGAADPMGIWGDMSWKQVTIGGRIVEVGRASLLRQDEHQRGSPYETATDKFVIISDDEAWVADALRQLP